MRILKNPKYPATLRKVANDDKTVIYGIIGTVSDLLKCGVLDYCDAPGDMWAYVDKACNASFHDTRDGAIKAAKI